MTNAFTTSGLFGQLFCDPAIARHFEKDAFVGHMLAFETVWTQALMDHGQVATDDGQAALASIRSYRADDLGAGSNNDGLPVPSFVAALKQGLSAEAAKAVHSGATSQDVIDTAMILTCRQVASVLRGRLAGLIDQIAKLDAQFGANPLMARTRMQAALPATAGLRLNAWLRPLQDHLGRPVGLDAVQIGGPIGRRDVPYAVCDQVAKVLDLDLGPVWHADRSRFADFGHWLALVAGTLGKIGQDVALMAQQGVDEITVSGGGGSSAMAHKQNPIAAESLVTLSRYVAGQQGILLQAMVHEQERSGAAWALEWMTLPAMAEATGAALNHAVKLTDAITRIGSPD